MTINTARDRPEPNNVENLRWIVREWLIDGRFSESTADCQIDYLLRRLGLYAGARIGGDPGRESSNVERQSFYVLGRGIDPP